MPGGRDRRGARRPPSRIHPRRLRARSRRRLSHRARRSDREEPRSWWSRSKPTSIPRRIQSSKSLIEQVVVEPNGARSIARIRLAHERPPAEGDDPREPAAHRARRALGCTGVKTAAKPATAVTPTPETLRSPPPKADAGRGGDEGRAEDRSSPRRSSRSPRPSSPTRSPAREARDSPARGAACARRRRTGREGGVRGEAGGSTSRVFRLAGAMDAAAGGETNSPRRANEPRRRFRWSGPEARAEAQTKAIAKAERRARDEEVRGDEGQAPADGQPRSPSRVAAG